MEGLKSQNPACNMPCTDANNMKYDEGTIGGMLIGGDAGDYRIGFFESN